MFLDIKLFHAHLQYVCNIPAKYQMNILKALGGVDFTKYALLPISQYVQVYLIITLSLGSIGTDRVISETVL